MTALAIHSAHAAEQDDIEAVKALVHETAERWNSQDYRTVLELWDPDEEVPFYLAEEQDGWFIGWEPLKAYLSPPLPSPVMEGLREEMRDISVKLIADDLAIAAWYMHFEMKMRGRPPIGEDVRVSAVMRKKPEGWRYIHWAESPMTALVYIEKLFQRDVDHEKFSPLIERSRKVKEAWRAEYQAEQASE
ncbi:MAG: nuclear transport factor 2 family protein [Gammaproteobacteria bacterium]|nr:nuclear transport factor 2 family protein [Gammaproteobacteria bacterium]MDE0413150.1 nuclear transport factor 2 family protein [Gammaproteobacteria bacterium]MDE0454768.1 nuclear transport factor 2 family protein [Gammaproteobacteria bacterium]